jgi:hypothetical protein
MKIKIEKFKVDVEFTVPIGELIIALSPEGKAYVCDMSIGFEFVKPIAEGWEFVEVFNRIEAKFKIPAGFEVETAEDEVGNNYTLIPYE